MSQFLYLRKTNLTLKTSILLATCLIGLMLCLWGAWIPIKAQVAQILLKDAWQKSRISGTPHKAWSWADSWPVAKLTIPSLEFEAIILKEAGGEGLAFGPVLLSQSAPLGDLGMSVISAHRDTHFQPLANLQSGALIELEPMQGPPLTYKIDTMRVAPWNASGLVRASNEARLALTSCWPFGATQSGPLRFIAEATRMDTNSLSTSNATLTSK